jgi:hypothetical protein
MRDLAADMDEQGLVDVEAAEIGQTVLGEHGEPLVADTDHGAVEGAGTEVVHRDRTGRPGMAVVHRGVVRGGRDRFGNEDRAAETGLESGIGEDLLALRPPPRRMGDAHLTRLPREQQLGLLAHAAQNRGERVGDRDDQLTEPQDALVDASFRVRLEPAGIEPGPALRVPPDEDRAVLVGVDRRRHRHRTVDLDDLRAPAGDREHPDRAGGAEIDRQNVHLSPSRNRWHRLT